MKSQTDVRMRPLGCELSLLSRADGSASFSFGDETFVIACVYGPTDVRISKERIDKATVEVLVKPKIGQPNCASKLKEEIIRNSIDSAVIGSLHPRTAINVVIQEVQGNGSSGGSILAASINAACLALLDGGLPMNFMFAAVSCACVIKDDSKDEENVDEDVGDLDRLLEVIVDPDEEQEAAATAILTFAFESSEKKLVASHFSGPTSLSPTSGYSTAAKGKISKGGALSDRKLQECLSICSQAADEIFQFYRDCVKQKMMIDRPSVAKSNLVTVTKRETTTTKT